MSAALTTRDVVFALAQIVAAGGFVGLVLLLCWLSEPAQPPRGDDEPDVFDPQPLLYRIVRRPFDWSAHPDL